MRLVSGYMAADVPDPARQQERQFWSTPRQYRSLRDEFAELPTELHEAGELRTLGDKPLMVVTAQKNAQTGWAQLQDELATLSSKTVHRLLPDATHASLTEDPVQAGLAGQAIRDVVISVRTARPLVP
jgi:hypothetical protein